MNKVLLDENILTKLKYRLQDVCEVYTVNDKKCNALTNGKLIAAMEQEGFNYLITTDKNLPYQQNLHANTIGFIILDVVDNDYQTILPLVEGIKQ